MTTPAIERAAIHGAGYIYCVENKHYYKIGYTGNAPKRHGRDGNETKGYNTGHAYFRGSRTVEEKLKKYWKDFVPLAHDSTEEEFEKDPRMLRWFKALVKSGLAAGSHIDALKLSPQPRTFSEVNPDEAINPGLYKSGLNRIGQRPLPGLRLDPAQTPTDYYCTPPEIANMVREALGGRILFDPFSDATANKYVRAERFIDPKENIFQYQHPWGDCVYMNAPHSKDGQTTTSADLLHRELTEGTTKRAVAMYLDTQLGDKHIQKLIRLSKRIFMPTRFPCIGPDGDRTKTGTSGYAILYFGPEPELFEEACQNLVNTGFCEGNCSATWYLTPKISRQHTAA